MDGLNGILDIIWVVEVKMMKKKNKRWKEIVKRFKGKLTEMIKKADSKFDNYSISPKIRQILLHWGYELTESDL